MKKAEKLRDQLNYFIRGIRTENLKNSIHFRMRGDSYYFYIDFDNGQKVDLRIPLADFEQTEFETLVKMYQSMVFRAMRSTKNDMLQSKFIPAPIRLLHENKEMLLGFGTWCAKNLHIGYASNFPYSLYGPDISRETENAFATMGMAFSYYLRYLEKDKVAFPELGLVDLSVVAPGQFPDSEPENVEPDTIGTIENILKNDL